MKFRKKPIEIEAIRVADLLDGAVSDRPDWAQGGQILVRKDAVEIVTLEGTMRGDRGDWIIRGVQGELYPCKPDIFDATYEAVPE